MTRRTLRWLLLAVAASLVSCGGGGRPTQVMLLVDMPAPFRGRNDLHVHLAVYGAPGAASFGASTYDQSITGATWPYEVAIAPLNGDATRKWRATVVVTASGSSTAYGGSVEGGYVPGQVQRYDLCLQTCSDSMCSTLPAGVSMQNGQFDPKNVPASLNCQQQYFCAPPGGTTSTPSADLTCLGNARPIGSVQNFTLNFHDLTNALPAAGACVAVYADGVVPAVAQCNAGTQSTNATGDYTTPLTAGGWFAYNVVAAPSGFIPTLGFFIAPTANLNIAAPVVANTDLSAWNAAGVNWHTTSSTALAVIQVLDCQGNPIDGAQVRVITTPVSNPQCIQEGNGGAQYLYLDSAYVPVAGATATTPAGLALVANLPGNGSLGVVEVWAPQQNVWRVIGCQTIPLHDGEPTVATILPLDNHTGVCPDGP